MEEQAINQVPLPQKKELDLEVDTLTVGFTGSQVI